MRRSVTTPFAVLALALTAVFVAPAAAFAAAPDAPATPAGLGNDVSYPQCGTSPNTTSGALPTGADFGIVGVNDGLATGTNPCLSDQLAWADAATAPSGARVLPAVYVNTGNPGHAATWWPTSNTTRSGVPLINTAGICTGAEDAACAYVYGFSVAYDDVNSRGVTNPASRFWWLDVETSNTWSSDTAANTAVLEGMTAYFQSVGSGVGLYSTHRQWTSIAGTTAATSTLAGLPSWLSAATTRAGAKANCKAAALTPGGAVTMTQFVTDDLDYDVPCHSVSTTAAPMIGGIAAVGAQLTATRGVWHPAAAVQTVQWYRDGVAIPNATDDSYTVQPADLGTDLTVTVTGTAAGFLTAQQTSTAFSIPPLEFTAAPVPKIQGPAFAGSLLTAATGNWAPGVVPLTYQWLRDGIAVDGATSAAYLVTAADAGSTLSLAVTGSSAGYRTLTRTSAPIAVPPDDTSPLTATVDPFAILHG